MSRELAQLLIDEGIVAPADVERALARQREAGGALDSALLELGLLGEERLAPLLARASRLPAAPASAYLEVDARARRVFPAKVAERHGLAPFALDGRELSLVAAFPVDLGLLDEISFMLSLQLTAHVGVEWRVRSLIHRLYGSPLSPRLARLAGSEGGAGLGPEATPAPVAAPAAAPADLPPQRPSPLAAFGHEDGEQAEPLAAALAQAAEAFELDWDESPPGAPASPTPAPGAWSAATPTAEVPGPQAPAAAEGAEDRSAPPRWTLDQARQALAAAASRDEVVLVALRYARDFFDFAAAFAVAKDAVVGHDALGAEDGLREVCRTVAFYASEPGIVANALQSRAPYLGPVTADAPGNVALLDGLGREAPRTSLVYPVVVRDRPVCVLFADNGQAPVSGRRLGDLFLLLSTVGAAMERIIRARKARPPEVRARPQAVFFAPVAVDDQPAEAGTWAASEPALRPAAPSPGPAQAEAPVHEEWRDSHQLDAVTDLPADAVSPLLAVEEPLRLGLLPAVDLAEPDDAAGFPEVQVAEELPAVVPLAGVELELAPAGPEAGEAPSLLAAAVEAPAYDSPAFDPAGPVPEAAELVAEAIPVADVPWAVPVPEAEPAPVALEEDRSPDVGAAEVAAEVAQDDAAPPVAEAMLAAEAMPAAGNDVAATNEGSLWPESAPQPDAEPPAVEEPMSLEPYAVRPYADEPGALRPDMDEPAAELPAASPLPLATRPDEALFQPSDGSLWAKAAPAITLEGLPPEEPQREEPQQEAPSAQAPSEPETFLGEPVPPVEAMFAAPVIEEPPFLQPEDRAGPIGDERPAGLAAAPPEALLGLDRLEAEEPQLLDPSISISIELPARSPAPPDLADDSAPLRSEPELLPLEASLAGPPAGGELDLWPSTPPSAAGGSLYAASEDPLPVETTPAEPLPVTPPALAAMLAALPSEREREAAAREGPGAEPAAATDAEADRTVSAAAAAAVAVLGGAAAAPAVVAAPGAVEATGPDFSPDLTLEKPLPKPGEGPRGAAGLVEDYLASPRGSEERTALLALLTQRADEVAPLLCERLPGRLDVEPEALARTPVVDQGPVLAAVAALGAAAARPLVKLLADPDPERRRAAAALLGLAGDPAALAPLAERCLDTDARVAEAARLALASHRLEAALKQPLEKLRRALLSGLADKSAAAARAIGALRDAESIPLLIQALEGSDKVTAGATADALAAITMQKLGPAPRAWLLWWKQNRGKARREWLFGALADADRETRLQAANELREAAPSPVNYSADLPEAERQEAARAWAAWFERNGYRA